MKKQFKNMITTDFYCTQCGNKNIPVWRKEGEMRESGHLKKLYCINCLKETNHVEVRELGKYKYKDFLIEFNGGNFNEEGKRIVDSWKTFEKLYKEKKEKENDEQ